LAIDQAVRALEGTLDVVHAGPAIVMVTPDNIDEVGTGESLAPAWFSPVFTVD
jgi:protein TorT